MQLLLLLSVVCLARVCAFHNLFVQGLSQKTASRIRRYVAAGEPPLDENSENESSMREQIEQRIRKEAPSDLEMRMMVLGINSWTIAGFVLAAALIALNTSLGTGWAGRLFGMEDVAEVVNTDSSGAFQDLDLERVQFKVGEDLPSAVQQRVQSLR